MRSVQNADTLAVDADAKVRRKQMRPYSTWLLLEENIVSLRTTHVLDDGDLLQFRLRPADLESVLPKEKKKFAPKDFDWTLQDCVWLYRHKKSPSDELKSKIAFPWMEEYLKPMSFKVPPQFKLLWTDSGHSVALYLNDEPWAFIEEEQHQGYSKGILKQRIGVGNLWNQQLFEKIFFK